MKIYSLNKIAWLLYRGIREIEKNIDENGSCYYVFDQNDKDVEIALKEFKQHEELHSFLDMYASVINDIKDMKNNICFKKTEG